MARTPAPIARFLEGKRIAVAGVSRAAQQPANAIYRKLRNCGYDAIAVNPNAAQIEGAACFPSLTAVPGPIDGVVIVTHPKDSITVVHQAAERGIDKVWFHRSFGDGSVSDAAVRACEARGISCIVGGCPMMYCEPVDLGHRCFRWWLGFRGTLPR